MAPIQPVCSGSLAQQRMGKDGACPGHAPTWILDIAVARTQVQMLGNSPGLSSVGALHWTEAAFAFRNYSA